jgi:putative spermidine/putrescine transport system ATP-binding protein
LRLLQQRLGITTIVVTHDQREAMTMADRIVVMGAGRVEQSGPPQEIYHRPATAFVAGFIGRANFFDGVANAGRVLVGNVALALPRPINFVDGAQVRLACRPEAIGLVASAEAPNRITGLVTFVRDLGPVRDIHLDTPLGPVIAEQAAVPGGTAARTGDTLALTLPPDALRVYPRTGETPAIAMAAE